MLLAATGLLGIGYEVLVVRVLSQVAENTVYTFAMLLAVYLIGTALGAAAYQRWCQESQASSALRDRLLFLLAAACLLGSLSLWGAEAIKALLLDALDPSMATALIAEAGLAMAAFLLPTMAMGALFSHLACQARAAGIGIGRALAANTLGAAAAPLAFGVVLLPAMGPKFALLIVVAGYLALSSRPSVPVWAGSAVAAVLALLLPPLAFIDVPEGGRIVSYREGAMAAVSVVEDAAGVSRLRIDNRQQEGSSASGLADSRQAFLPLLLHPAPRRALFLGLGTGVTASAANDDPLLKVDAVELLPEVIDASAHFTNHDSAAANEARFHVIAADARRFVRASAERYDLIVSDNFHPARSGSGALYTVEHFRAVQDRLAEGGVFCQWLPLHQLDLATLRSIVRAFMRVYPNGMAMLATNSLETPTLGLISRREGTRFSVDEVRARVAAGSAWRRSPASLGLADDFAVLGSFIAGPRALIRFAGAAEVNTDDHPVVAYLAPRITYAPDSLPRDRLMDFLRETEVTPEEIAEAPADAGWPPRLAAYLAARNRFLDVGRHVQPESDVRRMLAQVREPLLSVLRISPDFRPAYDPLLAMANALARSDAAGARALLDELARIQPERAEAAERLRQLAGGER